MSILKDELRPIFIRRMMLITCQNDVLLALYNVSGVMMMYFVFSVLSCIELVEERYLYCFSIVGGAIQSKYDMMFLRTLVYFKCQIHYCNAFKVR